MNDLNITPTQATPTVLTNRAAGTMEMRGDSYPENSLQFFAPIVSWVEEYLRVEATPLRLNLYLLYLNTSSVKAMMDIFDLLEDAHGEGREVAVTWFYDAENERIAELAQEFKEDCTFAFDVVRRDMPSHA